MSTCATTGGLGDNREWAYPPQDEATLKQHLSVITTPVQLLLFTQAIGGSETGTVTKQILGELAALNDKITVVDKNFVLDSDDKANTRSTRRRQS